ncbi:MAG: lysine 2,3-aminomutase [Deltaproteobacteria bacterium]|nr:lysine 2,3-aminomutase [Deltaproteobacteria bacterium]
MPAYANVPDEQWDDWKWQLRNRIQTVEQLGRIFPVDAEAEEGIRRSMTKFRMGITPHFACLIDWENDWCPIKRQMVPLGLEADEEEEDLRDPLHEDVDSPVFGITHRYPDRVLLLTTDECAVFCRYCTRRRLVGAGEADLRRLIDQRIQYIAEHKEVRDIIISGGDVLTLSDRIVEHVLEGLRRIPHVEIVRLGTRVPVVCPQRVTDEFLAMVRKYHPVYINLHFNHAKEITPEVEEACARMADAGIPLGNQSVLLRGVNDCPHVMKELCQKLLKIRVRPYYIYQCDLSSGISHFRTSVAKGIEIVEALRGHTSGLAVPTFVVDAPGGGGKIPVGPNYVISQNRDTIILRNYEGMISPYHEPHTYESICGHDPACAQERYKSKVGPAHMFDEPTLYLEPKEEFLK